jgi:hypothetical protein
VCTLHILYSSSHRIDVCHRFMTEWEREWLCEWSCEWVIVGVLEKNGGVSLTLSYKSY